MRLIRKIAVRPCWSWQQDQARQEPRFPADAIDRSGIENEVTDADIAELLTFDKEGWKNELAMIKEHYKKFDRLPKALADQLTQLEERLSK